MANRLIVAAAGSGKTTYLVREALRLKDAKILVTTFTEANERELQKKFCEEVRCVPTNITVQTWFSFLLQHGVRPYQGRTFPPDISGVILVNGQSAHRIPETNTARHYFSPSKSIYSDKLAKFAVKCNAAVQGAVIARLSRIYTHVFIDEVQDLAGDDLTFLRLLFASSSDILMVGDPRQAALATNHAAKNSQYRGSHIIDFFDSVSKDVEKDERTLNKNHRSIQAVCDFSNKLYPAFPWVDAADTWTTGHDGIFLVAPRDVDAYLATYRPIQLRYDAKVKVNPNYDVMTFGGSKGLSFDRVLIFSTEPIRAWLKNSDSQLGPVSRSKFYVAITRATTSVAIVYDYRKHGPIEGLKTAAFDPSHHGVANGGDRSRLSST